ncbi:MAG TPA: TOBE domain-containing protein, partial [Mycobacterium sp.]|nr:TOBE domain-containing protein [Mycobacterium sp.]
IGPRNATVLTVDLPDRSAVTVTSGAGLAMVRPESVTVTADPSGRSTVSSVAFLGPISRVYVTLPDGGMISAQLPSSAARAFAPGDAVAVGMESDGVLVVPSG